MAEGCPMAVCNKTQPFGKGEMAIYWATLVLMAFDIAINSLV